VDLAEEATAVWLDRQAVTRSGQGSGRRQIPDPVRAALTHAVQTGLAAAVRDVIVGDQQDVVLRTLTQQAGQRPGGADIAPDAALPEAVVQHISPRLDALAIQGLHVDRERLARRLDKHITLTIRTEIRPRMPGHFYALLAGMPGTTFGDDEDEDEE
jgi:hypothetical protein